MDISNNRTNRIRVKKGSVVILLLLFSCLFRCSVYAVDTKPTEEFSRQWEERKSLPVDTNIIEDWPQGPLLGVESAILMEADTGTILYSKNIDEPLYPASITKMMTSLLVVENCSMEETVTFSDSAIDNTEWGSSRIGIMKGEQLTVEECLYGLLLGSANEVAYGLAEHVGGTLDQFVEMMNDKAATLGCENTHFANASGLPDPNHYVSAHDMARIAQAFFNNDTLCLISGSYSYTIPPTNKTTEKRPLENHHKMVAGKKYEYEGVVGGKTGFTTDARQTLVTCAQKDGMKLICVVMKDESPYQFLDTQELFNYGFDGFKKLKISDYETRYNITSSNFFNTNINIMGSTKSILTLSDDGYVVIPKTIDFENVRVEVDYNATAKNAVCNLDYYVGSNRVGNTTIDYANNEKKTFEFANIITDSSYDETYTYVSEQKTVFVTITEVLKKIVSVVGILFIIIAVIALVFGFIRSAKRAQMKKKKRYKQRSENSHRYNYKKRSENMKRKEPAVDNSNSRVAGKKYIEPMYKELSKRSASAAESETINEIDIVRNRYEEELYFDNSQANEEYYNEADYEDYGDYSFNEDDYVEESNDTFDPTSLRSYTGDMFNESLINTVPLHPLDDPNRWE